MVQRAVQRGYRFVRRLVVAVIGGTVVLVGVTLIVLPGPAFVVIPLGLGILALEFAWAGRLLARARAEGKRAFERMGGARGRAGEDPDGRRSR